MRQVLLLCGLMVAALAVAGCGGSNDSSAASSISKEKFIAKADAVCKRSNERMEAGFAKFLKGKNVKKPSEAESEKLVTTVLVPNIKREVEEIKALGVPDGDEEKVDAMVSALEEGLETAEKNPEVVAASSSDTIFGIASRIGGEYGLTVCGSR